MITAIHSVHENLLEWRAEQWKTVSDWTAQPLMESTSTIASLEARRRKVTPEGRNMGGQVVCAATADKL